MFDKLLDGFGLGKAVGNIGSNIFQGIGNKKMLQQQQAALNKNKAFLGDQVGTMKDDYTGMYQQYMDGGMDAYGNLQTMDTNVADYGEFNQKPLQDTEGYKWRMQEGLDALDQSAIGKGNLFSGAHMKGVTDYAQGLASQEYDKDYNRQFGQFQDARDYQTNVDTGNMNRNLDLQQYLANTGIDATGNVANTNLGLDQDYTQGMLDMNTIGGDLAGARKANPWMTMGAMGKSFGGGYDNYNAGKKGYGGEG